MRRFRGQFPEGGRTFRGKVERLDVFAPEVDPGGALLAYATADGAFGVRHHLICR